MKTLNQEPTLLIGIGAAKCATTWLHRYLKAHPQCLFGPVKEMHLFDTSNQKDLEHYITRCSALKTELQKRLETAPEYMKRQVLEHILALDFQLDILRSRDVNAYTRFLSQGIRGERVFGEITPAYSTLPESHLKEMLDIWPDTRLIYLMRDPVERLWSHIRMIAMRRDKDRNASKVKRVSSKLLERYFDGKENEISLRGNYAQTLKALTGVPGDRRIVMFAEHLLTEEGIFTLCDLLGIDRLQFDVERKVMAGVAIPMDASQWCRAMEHLAPQYAAARDFMGWLPESWGVAKSI
ncbi:MAG: hypothetical protein N838_24170 [Thiohalocapsa sp. PB-PSB1]|nr:MAG: hypothetical protein N838_24170 [Thiohalocapsa sp. PB-PSB1]MBL4544082.1 sulfotransferase family protein [Paracoccaceae bacterium]